MFSQPTLYPTIPIFCPQSWKKDFLSSVSDGFPLTSSVAQSKTGSDCACKSVETINSGCCKNSRKGEEEDEIEEGDEDLYESTSEEEEEEVGSEGEDVDMEDLGSIVNGSNGVGNGEVDVEEKNRRNEAKTDGMKKRKRIVGKKPKKETSTTTPREMITPALRTALTKQVNMGSISDYHHNFVTSPP